MSKNKTERDCKKTPIKSTIHYFKVLLKLSFFLLLASLSVLTIFGAFQWSEYTELFNLDSIEISGCSIITPTEVLKISGLSNGSNILQLDLLSITSCLEASPYIKAALVSRHFPKHMRILIQERIPLCYLNRKELILIDTEGIALPVPKKPLNANLPVISGFDDDSLIYASGCTVPNPELIHLITLILELSYSVPDLFPEISEIHYHQNGGYTLYTVDSGAPIYLGKDDLDGKLNILAHFQYLLQGKRRLRDYQYLDLRWKKQIIAREKV